MNMPENLISPSWIYECETVHHFKTITGLPLWVMHAVMHTYNMYWDNVTLSILHIILPNGYWGIINHFPTEENTVRFYKCWYWNVGDQYNKFIEFTPGF